MSLSTWDVGEAAILGEGHPLPPRGPSNEDGPASSPTAPWGGEQTPCHTQPSGGHPLHSRPRTRLALRSRQTGQPGACAGRTAGAPPTQAVAGPAVAPAWGPARSLPALSLHPPWAPSAHTLINKTSTRGHLHTHGVSVKPSLS